MKEYDNVKDTLKELIELAEAKVIYSNKADGTKEIATQRDVLELIQERVYMLADLLGMSELYLDATVTIPKTLKNKIYDYCTQEIGDSQDPETLKEILDGLDESAE